MAATADHADGWIVIVKAVVVDSGDQGLVILYFLFAFCFFTVVDSIKMNEGSQESYAVGIDISNTN